MITTKINNASKATKLKLFQYIALTNCFEQLGYPLGDGLQDNVTKMSMADVRENMLADVVQTIFTDLNVDSDEYHETIERVASMKAIRTTNGYNFY